LRAPTMALRSREVLSRASKRSRWRPWPGTGASVGRSGESERPGDNRGGVRSAERKPSSSSTICGLRHANGERGSGAGDSMSGAGVRQMAGTGEAG
jgi:hypothetical protein